MQLKRTFIMTLGLALAVTASTACSGDGDADTEGLAADSTAIRAADARTDTVLAPLAEQYVRLVLAVGQHDSGYVDAYYGPESWAAEMAEQKLSLDTIRARTDRLLAQVNAADVNGTSELVQLRKKYLVRQLQSVQAFAGMLAGEKLSFDDESRALYDAVAPTYPASHFQAMVDSLSTVLPGEGPLAARVEAYRRDFIIPAEKLDTVFRAAIAEGRRRTAAHMTLPENESFVLEFVTGKPWSGYNWYKGNATSLIQINSELPIYIERAIDVGAHEGYPGHHLYNALLEQNLVDGRGWPEFSVYPLFSPQSLIAEGSANYGIDVAFPGDERLAFERDVLFPLAGLDKARAEEYAKVRGLIERLSYAGNEAARMYLNGDIGADSAATWLTTYALMEPARAQQRVKFFDTYRSYVINYNYGRDLVAEYVESKGGTANDPAKRWSVFQELLSSPRLPSDLK